MMSEEYGAVKLCEKKINDCAYACAEKCCGLAHSVTYDGGNCDCCRKDCKQLLKSEHDKLSEFRLVFDVVNEIHFFFLLIFYGLRLIAFF